MFFELFETIIAKNGDQASHIQDKQSFETPQKRKENSCGLANVGCKCKCQSRGMRLEPCGSDERFSHEISVVNIRDNDLVL